MSQLIDQIIKVTTDHIIQSRPSEDRYSQHSDFICRCGQVFVATGGNGAVLSSAPRDYPGLALIHRAEVVAGLVESSSAPTPMARSLFMIETLRPWTVLRDASPDHTMIRLNLTYNGETRWVTQDGRTVQPSDIALPATVLWWPQG